jgi:hypothetical protein
MDHCQKLSSGFVCHSARVSILVKIHLALGPLKLYFWPRRFPFACYMQGIAVFEFWSQQQ